MRLLHILRSRLRSIVFRDRRESDLSEELQLHLERETDRLQVGGLSRKEARFHGRLACIASRRVDQGRSELMLSWLVEQLQRAASVVNIYETHSAVGSPVARMSTVWSSVTIRKCRTSGYAARCPSPNPTIRFELRTSSVGNV